MNREERNVEHRSRETGGTALGRILSVLFTILILLLIFRVVFSALGANTSNAFVGAVYSITDVMVAPFTGIFGDVDPGTGGAIEPAALIAIVVVAAVGLLLQKLVTPSRRGSRVHETQVTEEEYREPEPTAARDREPEVVRERVVEREVPAGDRRANEDRVVTDRVVEERRDVGKEPIVEERRPAASDPVIEDRRVEREEDIREEPLEETRRIPREDKRR